MSREGKAGKHQESIVRSALLMVITTNIVMWTLKCLRLVHSHSGGTVTGICRVEVCSKLGGSGSRVSLQNRVYMEQRGQLCGGKYESGRTILFSRSVVGGQQDDILMLKRKLQLKVLQVKSIKVCVSCNFKFDTNTQLVAKNILTLIFKCWCDCITLLYSATSQQWN